MEHPMRRYMPEGTPPTDLTYTMGRTMPQEATEVPKRHLTTTNNHFYEDLPAADKAKRPEYFPPADLTRSLKSPLTRGSLQDPHPLSEHGTQASGKGGRGELTRNPKEVGEGAM